MQGRTRFPRRKKGCGYGALQQQNACAAPLRRQRGCDLREEGEMEERNDDAARMQFLRYGKTEGDGRTRGDGVKMESWRYRLASSMETSEAGGWRRNMRKRWMGNLTEFEGLQKESTEEDKGAEWYISETTEIYRLKQSFFLHIIFASFYASDLLITV